MLKVIGAGLPRTGTTTLKAALERLLEAPCHHMSEVPTRPEVDIPAFTAAARGEATDWDALLAGYAAAVDWPTSAFYPEIAEHYPDALVVLSVRDDFESWWTSTSTTVFKHFATEPAPDADPQDAAWVRMTRSLWNRSFGDAGFEDLDAIEAAYHRYHERVRSTVPPERLIEFRTGAGWEPLCGALGLPVPDEPFPHLNTTAEFLAEVEAAEQ